MASVHIVLSSSNTKAANGQGLPVAKSQPKAKQTITSSATSQPFTSLTGASAVTDVWTVTSSSGDVWIKFGTGTPVASSGNDHLILAGTARDFGVTQDGEIPAVID